MVISFGSMSIGTRPSTNSNESYDGYGYVMSDYSGTSYGAQDDETDYTPTSWVTPNYLIYDSTVGSSRETYVHHIQTWLTNCSGYMTWTWGSNRNIMTTSEDRLAATTIRATRRRKNTLVIGMKTQELPSWYL
ncbi:hypothetical protein L3X38_043345 [Prunus dulcis]|uniref:Uncharacterized protein n=1 Tax=Prunus dulcis TaxID=3755 RepID=A0AAD4YMD6_PRUDU|nr:hypothetical protein L3X38_043345 [Prunus dulcis]